MDQLIIWVVIILILVIVFKLSSFLWRVLGFLAIIFIGWVFWDQIAEQATRFTEYFQQHSANQILSQTLMIMKNIFMSIKEWLTEIIA